MNGVQAGGRVINISSSLGQLGSLDGPDNTKYGGMPSGAYRVAIASAATLQQLGAIGFDSDDAAMRAAATQGKYPCPAYRATKAMLNRVSVALQHPHDTAYH